MSSLGEGRGRKMKKGPGRNPAVPEKGKGKQLTTSNGCENSTRAEARSAKTAAHQAAQTSGYRQYAQ